MIKRLKNKENNFLEVTVKNLFLTDVGFIISLGLKKNNTQNNNKDKMLPIFIGPSEAHVIDHFLEKKEIQRPTTHHYCLLYSMETKLKLYLYK